MDAITFRASFPPILTAIKRSGNGDGLRIQLDIPESDVLGAIGLAALTQERLLVTVKVLTDLDDETQKGAKRGGHRLDSGRIAIRRD